MDKKRMLMLGLYERMTLVVVFSVDRVSVLWEIQDYWAGKWHVCCEGPILHKITPLLDHSSSAV